MREEQTEPSLEMMKGRQKRGDNGSGNLGHGLHCSGHQIARHEEKNMKVGEEGGDRGNVGPAFRRKIMRSGGLKKRQ